MILHLFFSKCFSGPISATEESKKGRRVSSAEYWRDIDFFAVCGLALLGDKEATEAAVAAFSCKHMSESANLTNYWEAIRDDASLMWRHCSFGVML